MTLFDTGLQSSTTPDTSLAVQGVADEDTEEDAVNGTPESTGKRKRKRAPPPPRLTGSVIIPRIKEGKGPDGLYLTKTLDL